MQSDIIKDLFLFVLALNLLKKIVNWNSNGAKKDSRYLK